MNIKKNLLVAFVSVFGVVAAQADRTSTTPTGHWYSANVSEAQIDDLVDQGFRMHDIEVNSTNPLRYAASFVRNSGTYEKSWWWTADKNFDQFRSFGLSRNARPIDVEVTVVNGVRRFAGTFIRNSGADYVPYWTFDNKSFAEVNSLIDQTNGRLVDIEVQETSGGFRYTGILVRNSGSFFKNWTWYANRTADQLDQINDDSNLRMTDMEQNTNGRFTFILESGPGAWWYWTNRTFEQMTFAVSQFGSRVIDIERRIVDGQPRYNFIVINNSNAMETRVGNILRSGSDGARGFYLRQIGGGELGKLMADYQFYPASTIKVLPHFMYSYRVDQLGLNQGTLVPIYSDHTSDTHPNDGSTITTNRLLTTALRRMMVNSNNQDTNALQDFAGNGNGVTGRAAIESFKTNILGLTDEMEIFHKFGAGGSANNPANVATLRQFADLYEKAADGSIMSANGFTFFRNNMLNQSSNSGMQTGLLTVIAQEANSLGMTVTRRNQFIAQMQTCWKAGNWIGTTHVSSAGWIQLPFITEGGRIVTRQYVAGAFLEDTTNVTITSLNIQVVAESMREQLRAALQTWL